MDPQSKSTFAKLFQLDERKFANDPVKALPFSNRTAKRIRQAGAITIMDLLRLTPEMLMKISGFGAGCLEEIEQILSTLEEPKVAEYPPQMILSPEIDIVVPDAQSKDATLGEEYGMDPDNFVEIDIQSLQFSSRTSNVLMRNGIASVSLLLQKTKKELRNTHNFGKSHMDEIVRKLLELKNDTASRNAAVSRSFTAEECQLLATGDFSFLVDLELSEAENAFVARCIEAQEALGEELACICLNDPVKIVPILDMTRDFGRRTQWQGELCAILEELPAHRRNNQAIAYVNTFTRHEEERAVLLNMYPSKNAPLKAIVYCDALDAQSVYLAKRFLNWCKYDLQTEIAHLFSVLYPNERNQQVVQLRSQKKTLDQIGKKFGLTRERIRQLEKKMQRSFNARQGRIKIISKINADKNNATIVTSADVAAYCPDYQQELLFLLRGCESSNFTYDKDLDVFIVGDDGIHERAMAFVERLPDIISVKDIPKFYQEAKDEYDLPQEMVDKAISESYKLTGEVYHRTTLSLANIYIEIIKEYYPDGIDAYDPVTITEFRKLIYNKYGTVKLPENDRALSARIAGICILCGRGRYRIKKDQYIPKKLAQRICDYIEDSDLDIFMTNTLFAVFEKELRKYGVDNKYYLQGILHELYGESFTFTRDYISKDPSITSIYSSIINFIRDADYPVNKEQILRRFPGIPEVTINIATSDPDVLNFFGEYYHAESIVITSDEKNYLDSVTKRVISDGGIHHASEIYDIVNAEKPVVFTRNYVMFPFSGYSILEWLFRDKYQFSRPFVAQKSVDISRPTERLHDFVYSKASLTVSEISAFIKETRLYVQSILVFIDECNDRFLLTDSDTLQLIESTGIDAMVAEYVERGILAEISGTVPIRNLQYWGALPTIKVPWTEWLIYSVLKKWGKNIEVAPSYGQFRMAIPLVAPKGKMDTAPYADAYKSGIQPKQDMSVKIHDLDHIDDILADILGEDILGEDLWDFET